MSNLAPTSSVESCAGDPGLPTLQELPGRLSDLGDLGGLAIRRLLPRSERRLVGPWCFLDAYGPLSFSSGKPMDVAPHPHIGLYYLGCGRRELALASEREPVRALLIGGAPFGETILMWWNFVARSTDEIVAAPEDWESGRRFGQVSAYAGPRIPAPPFLARPVPR